MNLEEIAGQLRSQGKRMLEAAAALDPGKKKPGRVLSPDARKRISEAQRQRWAQLRKKNGSGKRAA